MGGSCPLPGGAPPYGARAERAPPPAPTGASGLPRPLTLQCFTMAFSATTMPEKASSVMSLFVPALLESSGPRQTRSFRASRPKCPSQRGFLYQASGARALLAVSRSGLARIAALPESVFRPAAARLAASFPADTARGILPGHVACLSRRAARLPPHGISRIEACSVVHLWTTGPLSMTEGIPRTYSRLGDGIPLRRGGLAPVARPSHGAPGPRPLPLRRSRGSVSCAPLARRTSSAARLCRVMLRRGYRTPGLTLFRDHTLRLVAGHGPSDEARANALDL